MNTSRSAFLGVCLRRSLVAIAFISLGGVASQSASAAINGAAAYNGRIAVPSFVRDVRSLIATAATRHTWRIIDERPGELTLQLNHVKAHMTVVAKAYYTKSELWFEKVGANTYQCVPEHPCQVEPEIVQRWMITLRREAGIALLRLAIEDAGGVLPR
jgi:hypothetical protein